MPPSVQDHIDQATKNERLLSWLREDDQFRDWVITVAFYAALHYVDAYLLTQRKNPANHPRRIRTMLNDPNLADVCERDFEELYALSRHTRYECYDPSPSELEQTTDVHLASIRNRVRSLLGSSVDWTDSTP